jgi:membrane protein
VRITQVEWPVVAKAVVKESKRDDVGGLAAEMAYHFIFSLFPFVIFLATIAGIVGSALCQGRLLDDLMNQLYAQLPPATAEALRQPLEQVLSQRGQQAMSVGAAIGFVLAIWSASGGVATLMKAFNRAYGVEETRGFLVQKGLAVGFTIGLGILLILGILFLTVGDNVIGWLAPLLGLGEWTTILLQAARLVLGLVVIVLAFAVLYWKGPNIRQQLRWVAPGTLFSTLALILLSLGFGLYVNLIGAASYAKTYGTAFGLILFLYFLFLASLVIVVGAEFNAETAKRYDPETIRDKIADPRKRLPGELLAPSPQAAAEAGVTPQQVAATNARSAATVAGGAEGPEAATHEGAPAGGDPAGVPAGGAAAAGDGSRHVQPPRRGATHEEADGAASGAPPALDRTGLVTAALAGAALVTAFAMGFVRSDRHH